MIIRYTFGSIAITIFSDVRHLKFPSGIRHSGQILTLSLHILHKMCPLSQRYTGVDVGGVRQTGHSIIFFNPSMDIEESKSFSSIIGKAAAIIIVFIRDNTDLSNALSTISNFVKRQCKGDSWLDI